MIKQTLLCVDDEIDNLDALERLFRTKYNILRSTSGAEALRVLDQYPDRIAVIITDQRMPSMTGVEFLEKSLLIRPDAVRILLTGYTDMESIVSAINSGQIYRYLNKPWDSVDLMNTVAEAVEKFILTKSLKDKNLELENSNQALSEALENLKSLDQAKSNFMMLVNHELKTPLTSLLSFAELLKETTLDQEQQKYLGRVFQGGQRLKDLIDDVLLLTGSESKTLAFNTAPFEPDSSDWSISPQLQTLMQTKSVNFRTVSLKRKVITDRTWFRQILMRLIHNAIKFSQNGSEIQLRLSDVRAHRVLVAIENQGPQVETQILEKMTQAFYINENSMNHSAGTGMGLAVCSSLLKNLSSKLQIQNTATGVQVSFELPCL